MTIDKFLKEISKILEIKKINKKKINYSEKLGFPHIIVSSIVN